MFLQALGSWLCACMCRSCRWRGYWDCVAEAEPPFFANSIRRMPSRKTTYCLGGTAKNHLPMVVFLFSRKLVRFSLVYLANLPATSFSFSSPASLLRPDCAHSNRLQMSSAVSPETAAVEPGRFLSFPCRCFPSFRSENNPTHELRPINEVVSSHGGKYPLVPECICTLYEEKKRVKKA